MDFDAVGIERSKELLRASIQKAGELRQLADRKKRSIVNGDIKDVKEVDLLESRLFQELELKNRELADLLTEYGNSFVSDSPAVMKRVPSQALQDGYRLLNEASGLQLQTLFHKYRITMTGLELAEQGNQQMMSDRIHTFFAGIRPQEEEQFTTYRPGRTTSNVQQPFLVNQVI